MKALITGANGFVGKYLLHVLCDHQVETIAVVRNRSSNTEGLENFRNTRIIYCEMDEIEKLPEIVADRDIDYCIHLAWEGANGHPRSNPEMQLKNISRTLSLCRALSKMRIRRFVGIGTLAEKDVNNYIPLDGATPNLVSCYGIAKLTAQYMSKAICTELGIEHIWCQLSNLYGIGDKSSNFINYACKLMLTGGRPSFTAGEQMYDFVYITDIAKGIYKAAADGKVNTAYYIGSGHQKKLKEFIFQIRDAVDPDIQLHLGEIPFNGTCLPDEEFDCSKLMNDTGYCAEIPFEKGIKRTVSWLESQIGK